MIEDIYTCKKKDDSLVSIIMPMYNAEKYVRESILSVQGQTYTNWELIVIDDGSTDKSSYIVTTIAANDKRIKMIRQLQNSGIALARNAGMREAKGRYLAFLDSDDWWVNTKLARKISLMDQRGCAIVGTGCGIMSDDGTRHKSWRTVPESVDYENLLKGNVMPTSSILIDVSKTGTFQMTNMKHEDYATWLRLMRTQNITAYGINEPLEYYRKTKGSASSNKFLALNWTWKIYRESEGFGRLKSLGCMVIFVSKTMSKYIGL